MSISSIYVVINMDLITDDMINESLNTESSFRKSLDGTQAILKFNTLHPSSMSGFIKYDHAKMLQFLTNNIIEWNRSL